MKRKIRHYAAGVVLCLLYAALPAFCTTYYVDPNGNDTTGDGSISNPWKTIPKAYNAAVQGDTIYVRGGRHIYTTRFSLSKSGTSSAMYRLFAYPGDQRPILDFSALAYDSGNRGITLSGSYWYIKGLDIYKAGDNGMIIQGTYNIVEFCSFYENYDTGLQLSNGAAYNKIINCDSYYNYDPPDGGDADGFAPKLTVGTGNYFYGCRSWQNSDDAYDCYPSSDSDVTTTFENCWAFKNGWYWLDGSTTEQMNGNGFKMGSAGYRYNDVLKNCMAFSNKSKGFDQNHNLGSMTLYNCTAFGNGGANYSLYEAPAAGKSATIKNCAAYTGGTNNIGAFVVQATNSWQSPFVVSSADFVNTNPAAAYGPRKADGSLPDINFMHLAAGSDLINSGTNVGLWYHGTKPDLGYFEYGGCTEPYASDVNGDCQVDSFDYALIANAWGTNLPQIDLNDDSQLNYFDIAEFAAEWLDCNRDPLSECWK